MQDSQDPNRPLVGRVGNQIVAVNPEAQGAAGKIGSGVTRIGKSSQHREFLKHFFHEPVSRGGVVAGNELADLVEVSESARMERK